MNKKIREPFNLQKELRLLPGYIIVILWVVFVFVVVGWIIGASFSTTKEIFTDKLLNSGIHFQSYIKAWTKGNLSSYFINSIIYTVSSLPLILLISAPCSYVLSRFEFKGGKVFQALLVLSISIPSIMIVLPIYSLATQIGILNSRLTLIFLYVCMNVPFTTFFLLSFFAGLPKTFEEAAAIDGATPIYTFFKIMLPLAQPGIITVGIFLFVNIWNEYFMALIFANTASLRPLSVGLYSMIQSMTYTGDWAGLFASVVVVFLPTFIMYIFLSEKIIAGVTGGALKE